MADTLTRRLMKELKEFQNEPIPELEDLSPENEDDILVWKVIINGESDTPYEGICNARILIECLTLS
jgi:peroxin-4